MENLDQTTINLLGFLLSGMLVMIALCSVFIGALILFSALFNKGQARFETELKEIKANQARFDTELKEITLKLDQLLARKN